MGRAERKPGPAVRVVGEEEEVRMGDTKRSGGGIESADCITQRDPALPASEEGAGIIPEDDGAGGSDTHLPASEADTSLGEEADDRMPQSWPGSGSGGTIPPPG
jgi:hypothetical protein